MPSQTDLLSFPTPQHPGTLPELVAVFDQLEANDKATYPAQTLTDQAMAACLDQGLSYSREAVELAVGQVQLSVLQPETTQVKDFNPGWRRPKTLAALERRMGKGSVSMAVARFLVNQGNRSPIVNGLLLAGVAGAIGVLLAPIWLTAGAMMIAVFVGGLMLDKAASQYIQRRTGPLAEAMPREWTLAAWAEDPTCRAHARQCLTSEVPMFLEGDVKHIEQLLRTSQDAQEKVRELATREKRMVSMKARFFDETETGNKA